MGAALALLSAVRVCAALHGAGPRCAGWAALDTVGEREATTVLRSGNDGGTQPPALPSELAAQRLGTARPPSLTWRMVSRILWKMMESGGEIHHLTTHIGADGKHYPRKPVSIFNPTRREERAADSGWVGCERQNSQRTKEENGSRCANCAGDN